MTMDTTEQELQRRFQAAAGEVDTPAGFEELTIAGACHARRRRATAVASAVAVVGVAAGIGIASVLVGGGDSSGDPATTASQATTRPTDSPESDAADAGDEQWIESLSRGANTSVPYVHGGDLRVGDSAIALGVPEASYAGRLASGGWLVLLYESEDAGPAVIDGDGTAYALPAGKSQLQNAAVSPDGTQFVYGSSVRAAGTWDTVAAVPADAVTIVGWTMRGIVFNDAENRSWLWDLSGPPSALDQHLVAVSESGDAGITRLSDDGCASVVNLRTGDTTLEGCDADVPVALSPDGTITVTAGLEVSSPDGTADLRDGSDQMVNGWAVGWESPDLFVFGVLTGADPNAGPLDGQPAARTGFVVRCSVTDGHCERASDRLSVAADDALVLAGDPA